MGILLGLGISEMKLEFVFFRRLPRPCCRLITSFKKCSSGSGGSESQEVSSSGYTASSVTPTPSSTTSRFRCRTESECRSYMPLSSPSSSSFSAVAPPVHSDLLYNHNHPLKLKLLQIQTKDLRRQPEPVSLFSPEVRASPQSPSHKNKTNSNKIILLSPVELQKESLSFLPHYHQPVQSSTSSATSSSATTFPISTTAATTTIIIIPRIRIRFSGIPTTCTSTTTATTLTTFSYTSTSSRSSHQQLTSGREHNFTPHRLFSTALTRAPSVVPSLLARSPSSFTRERSTSTTISTTSSSSLPTTLESDSKMTSPTILSLTSEKLTSLKSKFYSDSKNVLAQNACARTDPIELCTNRAGLDEINHVFNNRIETEGKPITNQKSSGRCWLFAFLNCVRIPFMKHYNIDEFEFSQSYLFFYDKLERCHYFLHNVVETYQRGEKVDGRLISFLLQDPCSDGGQWTMVSNLVLRYGLMPKKNFQESFSSESTSRLNSILRSKLREFCRELRGLMQEGKSKEEVQAKVDEQLEKIFRIISICLGVPKDQFTWEYYDKSKNYHKVGPITPLKFYEEYVKPVYKIDDKVCLVNDPREFHPYSKAYTIDCLGNVVGGSPTIYNNQHIDVLANAAVQSIKKGDPVWFGCEVIKRFSAKAGIEDLTIHDYSLVFGTDVSLGLTKAERLIYGESCMTHAMVFTACSLDDNGKVTKWRVENSWGDDRGEKGYFVMSADWFKEFVFELVVDKSLVPPEVMSVFDLEPTILPAWDPMGTLACKNCTGCSHCEF